MSPEKLSNYSQPHNELDNSEQKTLETIETTPTPEKQNHTTRKILATIGLTAITLTGISFETGNSNTNATESELTISQTIESLISTPNVYAKSKKKKSKKKKSNKPVSYKKKNGKLVCAHKNDKPSMSTKNSKVHMDMECCLDPDERPNPWCHYPRSRYGELLDIYNKNPF